MYIFELLDLDIIQSIYLKNLETILNSPPATITTSSTAAAAAAIKKSKK